MNWVCGQPGQMTIARWHAVNRGAGLVVMLQTVEPQGLYEKNR